jgi:hypothetical protein
MLIFMFKRSVRTELENQKQEFTQRYRPDCTPPLHEILKATERSMKG